MKMMVNRDPISTEDPFVIEDVQEGLRLEPDESGAEVERVARAAAMDVEGYAQVALLTQMVRVMIFDPVQQYSTLLPIGPVSQDNVPTVLIDGEAFTDFDFELGMRPSIRWLAPFYELVPTRISIAYTAGFGDTAADIPPDLAQAVIDQAALLFDGRSPMQKKTLTQSPHMARICARYRGVSV